MSYDSQAWNAFCDSMNVVRREQDKIAKAINSCINCKSHPARPDSLYCSDRCKQQFLNFGEVR